MIVPINKKLIFKNRSPFEIEKTSIQIKKIKEEWQSFLKDKKSYFNGDILVVTDIKKELEQDNWEIGKSKYADYIYAKKHKDLMILPLFCGISLKTKDDYYVLIINNHNTINLIGGTASLDDFKNSQFSPELCIEREMQEELGLNLKDIRNIMNYKRSYLKIPEKITIESTETCGIIFTGVLNFTKAELQSYFKRTKEVLDHEITELLFCKTKEEFQKKYKNHKKETYLMELLERIK